MTTTTQQKPIPDTRYVKQGAPTGRLCGWRANQAARP